MIDYQFIKFNLISKKKLFHPIYKWTQHPSNYTTGLGEHLLAVSENLEANNFVIYPNPITENILFIKGKNLSKVSEVMIFDISGRKVKSLSEPFKSSNSIDVSTLS